MRGWRWGGGACARGASESAASTAGAFGLKPAVLRSGSGWGGWGAVSCAPSSPRREGESARSLVAELQAEPGARSSGARMGSAA
ncbi:hypothetical protein MBENS4_2609 [Novosphingobium sp. MBES04]|nr:hypothetical protein MBENS4_2609 [Novosphingobium sp. MBES04]